MCPLDTCGWAAPRPYGENTRPQPWACAPCGASGAGPVGGCGGRCGSWIFWSAGWRLNVLGVRRRDRFGRLGGVVGVVVTPFSGSGRVDGGGVGAVVERLVSGGVSVVVAGGDFGEFSGLSGGEVRQVVDVAVDVARGRAVVFGAVGGDLESAVAAARYAGFRGVDGVFVHPPVGAVGEGWVVYHRVLADSVPSVGVVVRADFVSAREVSALVDACPNVVGVVVGGGDPVRAGVVARDVGLERVVWLSGGGELGVPGHSVYGVSGFLSTVAVVLPELSLRLHAALGKGDLPGAMAVWDVVRPLVELPHPVAVVKEALALLGVCGAGVRAPSPVLSVEGRAVVASVLTRWGLR
ncbi:dihydrodipicolinate synthase family protein [Actinosynnema sp. NPDC020468]|uniref:dihydrodipicolinate synthase family protein n=1 Tax=Actinosynnema sp. NPDC020468 TaxID=3154488 RepID=UPI0033E0068E